MGSQDWIIAVVAGAPLTSVGGVWLLGLVLDHVGQKLTVGRAFSLIGMLLFNGALISVTAICTYRGYVSYNLFHPFGWIWFFGIVWFILLLLFFLAGNDRKRVADFIAD